MRLINGWKRSIPKISFERYADDVIVHCRTKRETQLIKKAISARLTQCKLQLNAKKTGIVYCKDDKRRVPSKKTSFDFLGYTFRARGSRGSKGIWNNFLPAISNKAKLKIHEEIRSWRLHRHTESTIQEIAKYINPKIRGWFNYYGAYYKSAMYRIIDHIEWYVTRWVQKKYKCNSRKARRWLDLQKKIKPNLFAHWVVMKT